tara:strand:+ start:51 stop:383 length:333 start_codon:yes stop_codon:yes gene_type:complete
MEFYTHSDLYVAGTDEDGHDYLAEVYYVIARFRNGEQRIHPQSFEGCVAGYDYEYGIPYFEDVREEAKAKCQAIIDSNPCIDDWLEIQPSYGSQAYAADPRWEEELKAFD